MITIQKIIDDYYQVYNKWEKFVWLNEKKNVILYIYFYKLLQLKKKLIITQSFFKKNFENWF